jgi:hypothetical protein
MGIRVYRGGEGKPRTIPDEMGVWDGGWHYFW